MSAPTASNASRPFRAVATGTPSAPRDGRATCSGRRPAGTPSTRRPRASGRRLRATDAEAKRADPRDISIQLRALRALAGGPHRHAATPGRGVHGRRARRIPRAARTTQGPGHGQEGARRAEPARALPASLGATDATEILMIEGSRGAGPSPTRDALDQAMWERVKHVARARLHQGPRGRTSHQAATRDLASCSATWACAPRSPDAHPRLDPPQARRRHHPMVVRARQGRQDSRPTDPTRGRRRAAGLAAVSPRDLRQRTAVVPAARYPTA